MKGTEFLSPIEKGQLLEKAAQGNKAAIRAILNEFDRLESRVKDLELAASIVIDKAMKTSAPDWKSVILITRGK